MTGPRTTLTRIALGSIALSLAVISLTAVSVIQNRRQHQERAETAAKNLCQIIERTLAGDVSRIDLGVLALTHEAEHQLATKGRIERASINQYIAWLHAQQPDVDGLRIADEEGNIAFGSGVNSAAIAQASDREYFRIARDDPDSRLIISKPMLGRVTGRWTIVLAHRINHVDGSFGGVAYATVALSHFRDAFNALNLGKHDAVSLRDLDLGVIARRPDPLGANAGVGSQVVSPEFKAMLSSRPNEGSFEAPTGLDGVNRTVAYRRISNFPGYLIVGLSTDDYLADWRKDTKQSILLTTVIVLVTGVATVLLTRAWRRQERALKSLAHEEKRFRHLVDSAPDAMVITNEAGRIVLINEQAEKLFGYTPEELLGREVELLIPVRFRASHPSLCRGFLAGNKAVRKSPNQDLWIVTKSGQERPVSITLSRQESEEGITVTASIRDITERKRMEEEMRLASLVFSSSNEAVLVTDLGGTILAVNPAFTEITGFQPEEAIGQTPRILRSGRHDDAFYREMWETVCVEGSWTGEIWDRRRSGEVYPKRLSITTARSDDGQPFRYVAIFSDITDQKRSEEVIWRQANFDSLTGLPNREMFHDRLEQEIRKSRRSKLPVALFFIDLDRFKEINDTLGHDKGDVLLKEAAQRLSRCVRDADTVARLGGDEFTVIIGELTNEEDTERVAQEILRRFSRPFDLSGESVYITGSIGITLFPNDGDNVETLLKHADQAMYNAKMEGRNRYSYFTPAMQAKALQRMRLATDLRSALAADQFRVFYQPIVDLRTGAINKAEALIRWEHPSLGLVSPSDFIPIAEETGMIIDIGDWVFHQAASQVQSWRARFDPKFQVSVNKSPIQFRAEGKAHGPWVEHLTSHGLLGDSIVVEITEGLLMESNRLVTEHLLGFRDAGIQVALDDFGTGYSSLSYLRKFDIDYVKIDKSFVDGLMSDSNSRALCEAIVVMAHRLGIKVIAEGVEHEDQCRQLTEIGCDFGQGYLFSRPVTADAFEALLTS